MDLGKDEGSLPQPTRKKFVIPLEDEAPPAGVRPLFRSSRNPSTTAPSVPAAPQTYAEYAIAQPPGGAGPTGPTGSEPVKGENPGQTVKTGAKSNSILVSPRQWKEPLTLVPFPVSTSLRYHNLHPDYIHERLQSLGKSFALRVLLVQVDVKDPQKALKDLAKMCILADCTLVLAWSAEEAGRYLETYKAYEQKPADLLMEKLEQNFLSRVRLPPLSW
uniref:ERCC excision repair 1, endonuclease non-catalytic subunit n=1 Tax=Cricetulus griseus TaxID=10029 RepID=A0A8C2LBP2_CRIGR